MSRTHEKQSLIKSSRRMSIQPELHSEKPNDNSYKYNELLSPLPNFSVNATKVVRNRLLLVHISALLVHTVSTIGMLVFVFSTNRTDLSLELYDYKIGFDLDNRSVQPVDNIVDTSLNLAGLTLSFSTLAVLAQSYYVYALYHNPSKNIQNIQGMPDIQGKNFIILASMGINMFRWVEYFFSASIMIVIIARLCGVLGIYEIICIFFLVAITQCFGAFADVWNVLLMKIAWNDGTMPGIDKNGSSSYSWITRIWPHLLGWIPQTVAWTLIFIRLGRADRDTDNSMPTFVWVIVFLESAFFSSFGFVQLYVHTRGIEGRGICAESAYGILSAVSKPILAWTVLLSVPV